jgi:hypothetical protein
MNANEEEFAFYFELGFAITRWAAVESALGIALAHSVEGKDAYTIYVSLFSIENFRSKLQFAESILLDKYKENPHIKDWPSLRKRLESSGAKRNKLAHLQVGVYSNHKEGRRLALEPWPKSGVEKKRRRKTGAEKPAENALCLLDIHRISIEFVACYCAVTNFSSRLRGEPEMHAKSLEQGWAPRTIRSLNARMHEALGHRLQPSPLKSSLELGLASRTKS